MRKLGTWGVAAVLLLALGSATRAAPPKDDDDDDPKPVAKPPDWNPAIAKLFGLDKKADAKPDKAKDKDKEREAPPPQAQAAAHLRALEEAKLHRRQDVCLRLREIALQTHDDDLERKASQLSERAWEIYLDRTKGLIGGDADTARLRRRPAADDADAARLTAPGKRQASRDADDTASVREVRP